jgi:hypothetical protein
MYRTLIETVRDKIITDVTEFGEVLVWNNQIDAMEVSEERSYSFPSCFIGFQVPAVYTNESNQVQRSKIELTVYIVDETPINEYDDGTPNLDIFDLKQKVFLSLHNYTVKPMGPLSRISEETDEDHPNLYVFKQVYSVEWLDCEIEDNKQKATPTSAQITSEVIINPLSTPGVRTAKDVNDD